MRNIAKKATQLTWPAEAYKSAGDEDQFVIDYYDKKTGGYLIDIAAGFVLYLVLSHSNFLTPTIGLVF